MVVESPILSKVVASTAPSKVVVLSTCVRLGHWVASRMVVEATLVLSKMVVVTKYVSKVMANTIIPLKLWW